MSEEKTQINDINRSLYDFRYEENENDFYRIEDGLTKEIIQKGLTQPLVSLISKDQRNLE